MIMIGPVSKFFDETLLITLLIISEGTEQF